MESDLEKNCTLDLSPNTVLPSPRQCSNIEKRYSKGKPGRQDDILRAKEAFNEISFQRYRSASCRNPSRPVGTENNAELKRGSIYQSSKEVRKMKKTGTVEGRRKIELSRVSDSSFSFRIVDSLCNLEEESTRVRKPVMPAVSKLKSRSISKPSSEPCSSDGFIELCLSSDGREKQSEVAVGIDNNRKDFSFSCEPVVGPLDDGNDLDEKDTVRNLPKSFSAKVEVPPSPSSSESDRSRASSRVRFSPIRKMFDPFMKSKSLRSPLGYAAEADEVKPIGMENMRRTRTLRKSLLHDFSHSPQNTEMDSQFVKKDNFHSPVATSPVHLHGCLKLGAKHGVPFFEFTTNQPEEVFLANTWKGDNAFNWVYTFHSIGNRKKSNASIWGLSDSNKNSSIVAQMQVSCCLCSEIKDGGILDNSMVSEFVLFDVAHSRQHVSVQGSPDVHTTSTCSSPGLATGCYESDDGSNMVKLKDHLNLASDTDEFESPNRSTSRPPADLQPNLEIAAIVIQVPFKKRESLKYRRGDKIGDKRQLNLLNITMAEENKSIIKDSSSKEKVKVVIPTGNHGLPTAETRGPSSLLDRWRMGGGCDCGGWDMACPLVVFGNPGINCSEDQPLVDREQPFELFLQGAKESTPALTMTAIEGGYAVDFHVKLSALQAFSICVAILHGTETSAAAAGEAQSNHLSDCNSLKMLIQEEVKYLIEAVTEEGRKKVSKKVEVIPPSYVINPPFSPIARV
ncbi:hypothetical protein CCACVL1_13610 [Corchorus capsularis]|uniref:Bromo-adjacent domain-containing protein n=1 Tax=Corchorus capsularis TaxID=210143 RepID=A0A1R3IAB3_COCAP|nr:hypothetical protein CCACVL1_13610 [Corchorus capsularis]